MAELLAASPQGAKALAEAHGLPVWPAEDEEGDLPRYSDN